MIKLIAKNGSFAIFPIILSLLLFSVIILLSVARHPFDLRFIDIFSIFTGTCALLLTGYQIVHSISEKEKEFNNFEISETRNLLLKEIHEVFDICRQEFDSQAQIVTSLIKKINDLTIEVRVHANSIGHDSSIELCLQMQEDIVNLQAQIKLLIHQEEIISRLDFIELNLQLNATKKNYGFDT